MTRDTYIAANSAATTITTPIAILPAAAAARPRTAPQPALAATPDCRARVNSNTAAPMNAPTNPPTTEPMMGTGTPTMAPITPRTGPPQPARLDPPYF